ncbi:MAG: hypothetical protein QXN62_06745 [Candidatus Bathyarchaeia archaeon]
MRIRWINNSEEYRSLELIIETFGRVSEEARREVVRLMEDCYRRLSPHDVEMVDVMLFETSSGMEAYSIKEQGLVGVEFTGLESGFVATHEAWTGIPKILISMDRLHCLEPMVREATVRHEVAHSILHGSPEYYIFPIPTSLSKAASKHGLPRQYVNNILYLISIGVKDYEVTSLLLDNGFVEDQVAYSKHLIKTSQEDLQAWNLSKGDPVKELLTVLGRFKDLACTVAVSKYQGFKRVEDTNMLEELRYLPEVTLKGLAEVSWALTGMRHLDTFSKVEVTADLTVRRLIGQIL